MSDLEKMQKWLTDYPGFSGKGIEIDQTDPQPGSLGLYLQGIQRLSQREDLLGNRTETCRYAFLLRCVLPAAGADNQNLLLGFQHWVQNRSAQGEVPGFSDVPGKETIRAEKGRLEKTAQQGTFQYVVALTADFIKCYEVTEYGKN